MDLRSPWKFDQIAGDDGMGYVADASARDILHVGHFTCSAAENIAIGNISAAGPVMLAALRGAMVLIDTFGGDVPPGVQESYHKRRQACLDAIALAEGKADGR